MVVRVARSAFACALPRPSAIASAKFANRTVSQSQKAITPTNQSWSVWPRARSRKKIDGRDHAAELDDEHHRVPDLLRGSSFGNESRIAARTSSREKRLARLAAISCLLLVEREVELEHVHAGLAEEARAASVGVLVDQLLHCREREVPARPRPGGDWSCAYAGEMSGSMPEPEVVTASTGMSWIVRPGLYGLSSFRIASALLPARPWRGRGSSGPRLAKVVPPAL